MNVEGVLPTNPVPNLPNPGGVLGEPTAAGVANIAANCHGFEWVENDADTLLDINGSVPHRSWAVKTVVGGETIGLNGDPQFLHSRLEYFLMSFPPSQLMLVQQLMNQQIETIAAMQQTQHKSMTIGELLQFFGILVLSTKFEFGSRASLWSCTAIYKYIPAPQFGNTGMSRL